MAITETSPDFYTEENRLTWNLIVKGRGYSDGMVVTIGQREVDFIDRVDEGQVEIIGPWLSDKCDRVDGCDVRVAVDLNGCRLEAMPAEGFQYKPKGTTQLRWRREGGIGQNGRQG